MKWICGFANAQGGTLYIGKDDNGNVVGVKDAKKLLEELPNKITTILGIVVQVNLHQAEQGDYIENADSVSADQARLESAERKAFIQIIVDAHPNPVNYKGEYHYRSGSTKQELKGAALDKFLLQKQGKHWDAVSIPNVSVADLKPETFEFFRKRGVKSKRLDEDVLTDTNEVLLNNLKLTDNGYLKRAALLLFHPDPEKYVSGAYIKIGFFRTDSDLLFQDEIHGNLFEQVEKTMDLLFTKYIKAMISYEDIYRVETYEYPKDALREALLNAVAHKDYTGPYPIQISVYDNKIMIWNYGKLPENWTVEDLLDKHSSQPRNPDIATTFFRSGYVESWGRGMDKMRNLCLEAKIPLPQLSCKGNDFWTVFRKDIYNKEDLSKLGLSDRQIKAVLYVKEHGKITNKEYQEVNGIGKSVTIDELRNLVDKEILVRIGETGRGTYYELPIKNDR